MLTPLLVNTLWALSRVDGSSFYKIESYQEARNFFSCCHSPGQEDISGMNDNCLNLVQTGARMC